jgi:hypothetical protein
MILPRKAKQHIALISLICILIYCGLRMLPDSECGFLHYEVLDTDSDGIEFCKADSSAFLELNKLNFPIKMQIIAETPPLVGEESEYTLIILTPGNKPLLPHQIAKTHAQKIHLLIIDPSLEDYHHIHPEPIGLSGQWKFKFTPRTTGTYQAFAQMVPARTKKHIVAQQEIYIPGPSGLPHPKIQQTATVEGYRFELSFKPEQPTTRQMHEVTLRIFGENGKDVHLEPLMGAYAHMIAFDDALSGLAHLHPIPNAEETNPNPKIDFVLNTQKPGHYRAWAQVKIEGKEIFAPFDLIFKES